MRKYRGHDFRAFRYAFDRYKAINNGVAPRGGFRL